MSVYRGLYLSAGPQEELSIDCKSANGAPDASIFVNGAPSLPFRQISVDRRTLGNRKVADRRTGAKSIPGGRRVTRSDPPYFGTRQ